MIEGRTSTHAQRGWGDVSGVGWDLLAGDCLERLRELPDASGDAVISDPPYSSGGLTRGDRSQEVAAKYCQSGNALGRPSFSGDARDQRSWVYWCSLWLGECLRLVKPSGYLLCFTDWRQLPCLTDALQCGGWVWRGIVPWDKTEGARAPHTGYFRHQCEYVVWGTNGVTKKSGHGGPWPGCFRVAVRQADKHHLTGKPTDLMRRLVACVPPGGLILDPFAGSGSTGVGALLEGRRFLGIEQEPEYRAIAARRLKDAASETLT